MLIVIDVVSEVSKSPETASNVIWLLTSWHCTPLGQVIKGLEFWTPGFIIHLIGASVRGISLAQSYFAAFAFHSRY